MANGGCFCFLSDSCVDAGHGHERRHRDAVSVAALCPNGVRDAPVRAVSFRGGILPREQLVLFPIIIDVSAWYAGSALFVLACILALTGYAFQTALGGRPLFKAGFVEGVNAAGASPITFSKTLRTDFFSTRTDPSLGIAPGL